MMRMYLGIPPLPLPRLLLAVSAFVDVLGLHDRNAALIDPYADKSFDPSIEFHYQRNAHRSMPVGSRWQRHVHTGDSIAISVRGTRSLILIGYEECCGVVVERGDLSGRNSHRRGS